MDLNIVNNEEKFLSGKLEDYTLKGAENKFDDKGNPLPFPGCTIICNIPLNTDLSDEIISFQKKIKNFNPEKTYFYLPPSSFHMTLFDCCNFNTKNTNYWTSDIDPDMDYKDIAIELNKRIQNYIFPKELNLKLKMFFGGYSIILETYSEKDEKILRNCRDELSSLLKIKLKPVYTSFLTKVFQSQRIICHNAINTIFNHFEHVILFVNCPNIYWQIFIMGNFNNFFCNVFMKWMPGFST